MIDAAVDFERLSKAQAARSSEGQRHALRWTRLIHATTGSKRELALRTALVFVGYLLTQSILTSLHPTFWVIAYLATIAAQLHFVSTRATEPNDTDYAVGFALFSLQSVLYFSFLIYLWAQDDVLLRVIAAAGLVGQGIFAFARLHEVRTLALLNGAAAAGAAIYFGFTLLEPRSPADSFVPALSAALLGIYFLYVLWDRQVTDGAQSEDHSRAIDHARDTAVREITAGIAHQYNNALAAALGHLELYGLEPAQADRDAAVAAAHEATSRAATLTGQLQASAARSALRPIALDPVRALGEIVRLAQKMLPDGITIDLDRATADIAHLRVDRDLLNNALLSLMLNASDAMDGHGMIRVRVEMQQVSRADESCSKGSYVVIAVRDSGCGIATEVRHRVTDPFFSTRPPATAAGLGLSMAKGFAEQSGGCLVIDSIPGQGTDVLIALPAVAAGTG